MQYFDDPLVGDSFGFRNIYWTQFSKQSISKRFKERITSLFNTTPPATSARPHNQVVVTGSQTDRSIGGKPSIGTNFVSDYANTITTTESKTENPNPLPYIRIDDWSNQSLVEQFPLLEMARNDPGGELVRGIHQIFNRIGDSSFYNQLTRMLPSDLSKGELRNYFVKNSWVGQSKNKMAVTDGFLFGHLMPTLLAFIIQRRDYVGLMKFVTGISMNPGNFNHLADVAIRSQALFFLGLVVGRSSEQIYYPEREIAFKQLWDEVPAGRQQHIALACYNRATEFQQSLPNSLSQLNICYTAPILKCFRENLINPKVFATFSDGNLYIPVMDSDFEHAQLTPVGINWDIVTPLKRY
ncbi:hypothetical protein BJ085DRAFT_29995 [Dimargaris cristalligena]|uniref:Uncharacterized protein n=1 Tax=Dimargaris cristalligena TaxID=215637 RepID=A0A4Q0A2M9_9FUNG|nr:hypothetical protein BJ085DRAFT_29995 [Dimargaris cristalligena]|eukprot:RKP40344.1 hypothetical protein BJ085DRAFT_29995 [Dimargaris cristalligena]